VLNSCYVLPCHDPIDAHAIAALLNSKLAAAWLNVLAEPAQGGYRRYLAWTMSFLPIPHDWRNARIPLAEMAHRAVHEGSADPDALLATTLAAYQLQHSDIASLLAWHDH
jgi:hypothetical protein